MTQEEFEIKWKKIMPKMENLFEFWNWLKASGKQEEFENDLCECLDCEMLNGYSTEA